MNNQSPVGFDLTNMRKQIAELKASNTIIKSLIKAFRKVRAENGAKIGILYPQIKKLKKDNAIFHRLIALRIDPQ